eukprot:scaffold18.g2056.t1
MSSQHAAYLQGREDRYGGLVVDDAAALPHTPEDMAARLAAALPAWRQRGYQGIWLRIPAAQAALISPALQAGFEFHHAEPGYAMLTCWLPADVGVGAFVLNGRREVLVVQERWGPLRGQNVWKMVTGLVASGEDISEAAAREVLEETGVRASFAAVLAMRQAHGIAVGQKSDLFFVTALRPEPGQEVLTPQAEEVVAAAWMPLEEFAALPFYRNRPLFHRIVGTCVAWADGRYKGLQGVKLAHGESARQDLLLFGEGDGGDTPDDAWIGLQLEQEQQAA